MRYLLFALALFASVASAAPFIVSDPLPQSVTHCQFSLNGGTTWSADFPVNGTTTKICYADMQALNVPVGNYSIVARAVVVDALWGRMVSPASSPFAAERPGPPGAPSGTRVVATVPLTAPSALTAPTR